MPELQRGLVAAGSWFAIAYGASVALGLPVSASTAAMSAAYMGASAVASDFAHSLLNVYPSTWTSALGTGLFYAAGQRLGEGNTDYAINVASGAVADVAASAVGGALHRNSAEHNPYDSAHVTDEDGAVATA